MIQAQKIASACTGHSESIMLIPSATGFNVGHNNHQSTGKTILLYKKHFYKPKLKNEIYNL
jgi:hypothetical protein